MARKNGKTMLIAALVLAHLIGPEGVENGEIYSAANDRDQAAQIFKYCCQLIEASPMLRRAKAQGRLGIIDSRKRLVCYSNGTIYQALSRESKSKHGYNPTLVIYDELAQAIDRDLYDVLDTSFGARQEGLFLSISTQSKDPEHIFSQLVDDGLNAHDETAVCHLYAVPDEVEDIFDSEAWHMANPALGDFRLVSDLKKHAKRAERMPAFENTFRNLYLNQRVSLASPLIASADWRAVEDDYDIDPRERVYIGLDLSACNDLAAMVLVTDGSDERCRSWFWKPADMIAEHARRDHVPYEKWQKEGWLLTPPGRVIDFRYVAIVLGKVAAEFNVAGVAFDRWRIDEFLRAADEEDVACWVEGADSQNGIRFVRWGQGFQDMAPAVDQLERSVLNATLRHDNNPVLNWNMTNAVVEMSPAGGRKITKNKVRFRIDGAVALAMACGLKARDAREAPLKPVSGRLIAL